MQAGNLVEIKGFLCLLITNMKGHINEGNLVEVYIPWENKRIRGDHCIIISNTMI